MFQRRLKDVKYKTPLRTTLKLELARIKKKDKGTAVDVAHCIEDILQAVEQSSKRVKNNSIKDVN